VARQVLRFLGSRYGIALVLVVIVIGVVSVARAVSGPSRVETVGPPPAVATTVASSGELGDDSVATSESPAVPTSIPGAPPPDAVAVDFTRAWLNSRGVSSDQWVNGLKPYATAHLLDRLKGADPTSVPADAIRGPAQVRARDSLLTEVSVPVAPGTLNLRLVVSDGRWLVDSVDWERP
jgi:hypothetical protein